MQRHLRRYQVVFALLVIASVVFSLQIRNFITDIMLRGGGGGMGGENPRARGARSPTGGGGTEGQDLSGSAAGARRKKQLELISLNECTDNLLKFRTAMGFDLFVHCSAVDHYVSQSLQNDQKTVVEYRDFLAADIKRLLNDNEEVVALDIGANVGYYTILMARNGARVVAFEPLPANLRVLQANIDLHGLSKQVRIVAAATGLIESTSTLSLTPNSPGASTLGSAAQMPWPMQKEGLEVRVCNGLDELKKLGITHADLIKIDVEGFELSEWAPSAVLDLDLY
jgi:FkbM family methyltransferase